MRSTLLLLVCCSMLLAPVAWAAPCDALDAEQKATVKKLLPQIYPYDCCDETLDKCLAQKKVCKLAKRLRDDICRRVARGQDPKAVKNALDRRARSMTPTGKKASYDLSAAALLGEDKAPVTVVVYACARCPFCSKVVPELHKLISGPLKGEVKAYFRPFPIRSHEHSVEGGLAFVAAQKLGKLWPYLLKTYQNYDDFSVAKLDDWAKQVGLDSAAFSREVTDKQNRQALVRSKKEGLRNGVDATPTLFINGRKYYGDLDPETLRDVLDEEADRSAGKQFCDAASKRYFK